MAEILQYGPIIPTSYSIQLEEFEKIQSNDKFSDIFHSDLPVIYADIRKMKPLDQLEINEETIEPKLTCIPCIKGCSDLKLKDVKSYHGFNHDLAEFLKSSTHYPFHEFNDLFHIQDVIDTYKATYKKSDRCPVSKYKEATFFDYLNGGLKKRKNKTKKALFKVKSKYMTKRKTMKHSNKR